MIAVTPAERYLMGRTLKAVLVLGAASLGLTMSIDFLEALRQVSEYAGAGPLAAAELTLLRSPQLLMILSPFIMLFGTLMAFAQLARSLEVAVFRAAGFSVWRIIGAPVWLSLAIGVGLVTIVDPITTQMSYAADNKLAAYRGLRAETPRIFREGVWLRQPQDNGGVLILHSGDIDIENGVFTDALVWMKDESGTFLERYDADRAVLNGGVLTLEDASRSVPGGQLSEEVGDTSFTTSFALKDLAQTGKRPEVLNIWNLPGLMKRIGDAGIPLEPYALRLHELIATPLKLASMAVLACVFALPIHSRGGGTAKLILQGIAAGFLAFILVQFSQAIGEAGLIPVRIAAWTPPLVTLLIGMTLVLFREDG